MRLSVSSASIGAIMMLLSASVSAQPLAIPVTLYGAAMGADWISTARAGSTFDEINPLARPFTSSGWEGYAIGSALDTSFLVLTVATFHTSHPKALRISLLLAAAFRFAVAYHNFALRSQVCAQRACPPPFH